MDECKNKIEDIKAGQFFWITTDCFKPSQKGRPYKILEVYPDKKQVGFRLNNILDEDETLTTIGICLILIIKTTSI